MKIVRASAGSDDTLERLAPTNACTTNYESLLTPFDHESAYTESVPEYRIPTSVYSGFF